LDECNFELLPNTRDFSMNPTESALQVLVDFDNLPLMSRQKGTNFVLHSLLDVAAQSLGQDLPKHVTIRMYGGWYNGLRLTRKAQDLVRSRYFASPIPRCPTGHSSGKDVLLRGELARTLLSEANSREARILTHTMRTRPVSINGFRANFSSHFRCATSPCFIADLDFFLKTGQCPRSDGNLDISECVLRDEQKLVDVLLATDLMHLAYSGSQIAVLVSSDDDLWPAILQASAQMRKLVHVHTQTGGKHEVYEKLLDTNHYTKTLIT